MTITIGKKSDGTNLNVDLPQLLRTRLLVTANSGGGKPVEYVPPTAKVKAALLKLADLHIRSVPACRN